MREEMERKTAAFGAATDIEKIIASLPEEEILHMRRVETLVGKLAGRLADFVEDTEFPGKEEDLCGAASYHDIGKAWIPNRILTKPGRLTKEEMEIARRHPAFAKTLFDHIRAGFVSGLPASMIQPAMEAAVYHHEWWNGRGYPYGMGYDGIPLIARITSICDAYDAMTSSRAYRRAHTHAYACGELERNAGTQFDPALIRIFLADDRDFLACAEEPGS